MNGAASDRALVGALSRSVARRRSGARISAIRREPCAWGSSWWLEDVTLELDDGDTVDLVLKETGRAVDGGRSGTKPGRVSDPRRELWVYRSLLAPLGMGTPEPWAAVDGGRDGPWWLVLERVDGSPLDQVGAGAAWRAAAAWLGRFHARVGSGPPQRGPLVRHDVALHEGWLRRALERAAEEGARARLEALRGLRPAHAAAVEEALAAPPGVLHGEFYPSNVMVQVRSGVAVIRPLDWEMAGWGPQLLDLAALVAGRWSDEERAGMVLSYRDAVLAAGASCAPLDLFLRRLAACRLLLAVQWLGWTRGWTAPRTHRNDWLGEATRCAGELAG